MVEASNTWAVRVRLDSVNCCEFDRQASFRVVVAAVGASSSCLDCQGQVDRGYRRILDPSSRQCRPAHSLEREVVALCRWWPVVLLGVFVAVSNFYQGY